MNYSEFLESKMTIAPESGFELCREALNPCGTGDGYLIHEPAKRGVNKHDEN